MKKLLMILIAIFILPACSEKEENPVATVFAIIGITTGLILL